MKSMLPFLLIFLLYLKSNAQGNERANGVTHYNRHKAENGVTVLDQHQNSMMIDMDGKMLAKFPFGLTHILPDGTLIGTTCGDLVKYDSDLNLVWKTFAAPHHEITTDENGAIYLLSQEYHDFMGLRVNFDMLKVFSPDDSLIYQWHLFDHLEEFVSIISKSAFANNVNGSYDPSKCAEEYIALDPANFLWHLNPVLPDTPFEFTHFNSIQVLPENTISKKIPAFKKGNLLLSFNPFSCYGILNISTGKIEWVGYLPERTTLHTPLLTDSGTILVFQNSTDGNSLWPNKANDPCLAYLYKKIPPKNRSEEPKPRNWVSITEYDPLTNAKVWEYTATPKEAMQAVGLGNAQRLSNGNTLVCVANGGASKIFEVTPKHEIVWHFVSPEKDPKNGNPLSFYRAKRISYSIGKKIIHELK